MAILFCDKNRDAENYTEYAKPRNNKKWNG
jgi:hypothetical protein